jgi:hypothetical protein
MVDRRFAKKLSKSKGLDKPIFIIVSLTLAIMFLALIFGATSTQFDSSLDSFIGGISNISSGQ